MISTEGEKEEVERRLTTRMHVACRDHRILPRCIDLRIRSNGVARSSGQGRPEERIELNMWSCVDGSFMTYERISKFCISHNASLEVDVENQLGK